MSTLKAISIKKKYKSKTVVDGASFQIKTGEVIGLLGPNGAGKTTSFYMLIGLVPCDEGQILLDDEDITRLPIHLRARMGLGYLPQEASVFRKLTVAENILSILELRKELNKKQRQEILESLLNEFNITHLKDQTGISLSGGERRRVEIARSLAMEPKFIFLDEPFAGVDPISVGDIQQIVSHLTDRGIGVLITDHNVRETLGICERAYILNKGHVITEGTAEHILNHQSVRDIYLGENFKL